VTVPRFDLGLGRCGVVLDLFQYIFAVFHTLFSTSIFITMQQNIAQTQEITLFFHSLYHCWCSFDDRDAVVCESVCTGGSVGMHLRPFFIVLPNPKLYLSQNFSNTF